MDTKAGQSGALIRTDQLTQTKSLDLIKAVAHDIAKEVAHHIEIMYPDAVTAASSTFLLSVRGSVYNNIMAALDINADNVQKQLFFREKFRRHIRAAYKKIREQANER